MQFVVKETITQDYAVEAETAQEAIQTQKDGKGVPLPNRQHYVNAQALPEPKPVTSPALAALAGQAP